MDRSGGRSRSRAQRGRGDRGRRARAGAPRRCRRDDDGDDPEPLPGCRHPAPHRGDGGQDGPRRARGARELEREDPQHRGPDELPAAQRAARRRDRRGEARPRRPPGGRAVAQRAAGAAAAVRLDDPGDPERGAGRLRLPPAPAAGPAAGGHAVQGRGRPERDGPRVPRVPRQPGARHRQPGSRHPAHDARRDPPAREQQPAGARQGQRPVRHEGSGQRGRLDPGHHPGIRLGRRGPGLGARRSASSTPTWRRSARSRPSDRHRSCWPRPPPRTGPR